MQKIKPIQALPPPKNVIIEYEKATAVAVREVIEEGIFRVDPATYQLASLSNSEIRYVDRITDLPIESSNLLAQLNMDQKKSKEISVENTNQLYAQFLKSSSGILNSSNVSNMVQLQNNASSGTNSFESFYNNSSPNANYSYLNNDYFQNIEYETITTSVPENLAKKIIAEAQASGTLTKSTTTKN